MLANTECEASARLPPDPWPALHTGLRPRPPPPACPEEPGQPRPSAVCPRGRRHPSESSGAAEEFATEGGGGLREEEAEEAEEEGRKMAAVELEWIPETLYNTAISAVVDNYIRSRRDIRSLPENIQFDVYYKVRTVGQRSALLQQPLGPHPLPRPRTPAFNPLPLVAGSSSETYGAVSG